MSELIAAIEAQAQTRPTEPAIVFEGETIGFGDLRERVRRRAGALTEAGVESGDRVAVLAGNEPGFIELLLGCLHVGAVFVPLNTRLTVPELQFQIEHCDPRLAVAGEGFDATLADAAPARRRVALGDLVGEPPNLAGAEFDGVAPAMIVYTSGTTGRPKGATHTRSSLDAVIRQGVAAHDFTSADRGLEFLPLFHVGGLNIQTLPILSVGGTVLLHRGFDPDAVFDAFENDGPTVSIIVPTPMQVLIGHPRWTELDAGALRGVMTGSSIVPADLLDAFNTAGLRAGQVYGSTETGPTSVVLRFEDADRVGSCGRAIGTAEMRVVDEHGLPASVGEVQIRGPHLFAGYWNDAEATAAAFDGEWYRTGDVGEVDPDGWLTILDRLGDMLITGGENVYPDEVEPVLASAPGVAELTVIGLPDERWGQTPVAVVVAADGQEPTIESMREHGGARLARYKLPTRLELVEALPRTALGKVRKNELVARFSR